jgi:hypothetical protein
MAINFQEATRDENAAAGQTANAAFAAALAVMADSNPHLHPVNSVALLMQMCLGFLKFADGDVAKDFIRHLAAYEHAAEGERAAIAERIDRCVFAMIEAVEARACPN